MSDYAVMMDLVADWAKTAKEVLEGAGALPADDSSSEEIALAYFRISLEEEEAQAAVQDTLARLAQMEDTIYEHLSSVIVPDIRQRTKYEGNEFHFCWVFNQGEHIVELKSEYRIPL